MVSTALFALAAFVMGGFPTGVIAARARGVDLRKVGSGNVGATNVGRALGKRWAIVVLLIDAAKGAIPVLAAAAFAPSFLANQPVMPVIGLAAVLGHMFSVFLKGRGGKGVATSFGAALALSPSAALGSFVLYALLFAVFRISSVGSLAAVASYPVFLWLLGSRDPAMLAFGISIAVLVTARHRDNIRRLLRGEEPRS